ncbi:hypothetical protein SGM_5437 [Streptomyces griseoaurantiacus M045]|uniref:Uncharacterized protein n=1 Tax=Streptomyces griseoaurantiacus M045 TaxID=996637 RepID=F3NPV2_9ACTN|nr:hypothetical protein SGM_5437 [Streptomyces griseoaurantiacus M045]
MARTRQAHGPGGHRTFTPSAVPARMRRALAGHPHLRSASRGSP